MSYGVRVQVPSLAPERTNFCLPKVRSFFIQAAMIFEFMTDQTVFPSFINELNDVFSNKYVPLFLLTLHQFCFG